MKYPTCCYRIENKVKRMSGVHTSILTATFGEGELISISAETLAELARENREDIMFDFRILKMGSEYNYRVTIIHDYVGTKSFVKNDNEPFGEFLLRVAIERNYLPKEK